MDKAARTIVLEAVKTAIITELRHLVIDPSAPSLGTVMGSDWLVLVPLGVIALTTIAAVLVFRRSAPCIAEQL